MKHCAVFSPIPMNMAKKVLHQDLNIHTVSPFTTKKLKYSNPVSRPASFNTLADSLTRIGGGDVRIREHLVESFIREIENGNGNGSEYSNGSESVHSDSNTASTNGHGTPDDDLHRRSSELLRGMDADLLTNPVTPRHEYSTEGPSSHGSSADFTGDEYATEMAQLHHFPASAFAFRDPLNLEPRRRSSGAGSSTDPQNLDMIESAIEQMRQEVDAATAAALERATRQNEENRFNPKFHSPPGDFYDV